MRRGDPRNSVLQGLPGLDQPLLHSMRFELFYTTLLYKKHDEEMIK